VSRLKLAEGLSLPADEAVTQKYGFIGRSGSGKSYGSMKLAELFLGAGAQIIALDWVGIWWSLRLAAGGKAPGFEHVYIFGGEHADVPLEPTSGALMADLIVDKHISVVLDVMHFRKAERTRFATAFAEQFFHRKKTARTACHLFIEEAQAYLPQMVKGDDARMVGVFEDIGKVGRNYGIGTTLISQRPQAINKDVLNQVEVLLAFQTNGPQERKAIAGWTAENTAAGAAMMQELPGLPVGDALVWSPQWLRLAKRVHIAERETYNASSTPTQQAKSIAPRRLAKDDLDAIAADLAATIEKAKADDPKTLRARIAELERIARSPVKQSDDASPNRQVKTIEVLTDADRDLLRAVEARLGTLPTALEGQLADFVKAAAELLAGALGKVMDGTIAKHEAAVARSRAEFVGLLEKRGLARILEKLARVTAAPRTADVRVSTTPLHSRPKPLAPSRQLARVNGSPPVADGLTRPQQAILNALAWGESMRLPTQRREKVAFLADASPKSSAYMNNLGTLRSAGLIDYPQQGYVALTDAGRALAHVDESAPQTSSELQAAICAKLPGPQARIVAAAVAAYPQPLEREALAERAGASATSSAYMNNLGALRSLGLLDYPRQGLVQAAPVLFLEA
jgi:hypothetical protein